jgi:hypothetical protein
MSLSIIALFFALLGFHPGDVGGQVPIAGVVAQPSDVGGQVPIAAVAQPGDVGGQVPIK